MNMIAVSLMATMMLLVPSTFGQVPFPGPCPQVTVKQNFQPSSYLGQWYENRKYFAIFQAGGTCVTATYADNGNDVIGVVNRQFSTLKNRYTSITGTAVSVSSTGEAKLAVRFPTTGNSAGNYWVLDTDYTSYSVVWSCTNYLFFNLQFMWVLTRDINPSTDVITTANSVIKRNGLSPRPLSVTSQKNCPA